MPYLSADRDLRNSSAVTCKGKLEKDLELEDFVLEVTLAQINN
jgi:hypothetical protein